MGMKAEEPVERFLPSCVKGQFDLHRLIWKHDLRLAINRQKRRTVLTPILALGISTSPTHIFVSMVYPHALNICVSSY